MFFEGYHYTEFLRQYQIHYDKRSEGGGGPQACTILWIQVFLRKWMITEIIIYSRCTAVHNKTPQRNWGRAAGPIKLSNF
jgi:hypothetical protein